MAPQRIRGVDAIGFTAGIGENSPEIRARVCRGLEALGIKIDPDKNRSGAGDCYRISADDSRVRLLVVKTDEQMEITRQTRSLLRQ